MVFSSIFHIKLKETKTGMEYYQHLIGILGIEIVLMMSLRSSKAEGLRYLYVLKVVTSSLFNSL